MRRAILLYNPNSGRNPTQRLALTCGPGETYPVQVQADGEWLGRTPMTVSLVPNALRLLLPPTAATPD